jgi:glycine/serine hydroxymethyltransferase
MGREEMDEIARLMARALRGRTDDSVLAGVRDDVARLCEKFAPYPELA